MKKKKKRINKKRSEAAKKGWRTRRRRQREKDRKHKSKDTKKRELDEFIMALEDSPGNDRLKTLYERHYGEKGFKFEIENEILKVSISTKKTRGKKFSVRG